MIKSKHLQIAQNYKCEAKPDETVRITITIPEGYTADSFLGGV